MASIRARADSGKLFFDFRFQSVRCREQTLLDDTPANRRRLEKVLQRIELEIQGFLTTRLSSPAASSPQHSR